MNYNTDLQKAKVVSVYNHLIIDARLSDNSIASVFCPAYDVVSMCKPDTVIYIHHDDNNNFKVPYNLEFVEQKTGLVYACPHKNNDLFEEAFNASKLKEFSKYTTCHRLTPSDHLPHIDFELSNSSGEKCFVFVTNVYTKHGGDAVFPMEVNFFELEMFEDMQKLRSQGFETCAFMIIPRMDCQNLRFSWKYSPLAAGKLFEEAKNGLNFIGYRCNIDETSITLSTNIPILY